MGNSWNDCFCPEKQALSECSSSFHLTLQPYTSGWSTFGHPPSVEEDVQRGLGPGNQAGVRGHRESAEKSALRGRWGLFDHQNHLAPMLFFLISIHTVLSLCATVSAAAPAKPFDSLQDSQLFDAENSEPLSSSGVGCSLSQDWPSTNRKSESKAAPSSPKRWRSNGSTQRHRARGTEANVLYGVNLEKWIYVTKIILQTALLLPNHANFLHFIFAPICHHLYLWFP